MEYKIAVVEDDELILNMVKLNLEKSGYKAYCFSDGETMMGRAGQEAFDLVILDIMLPGMSGVDVLRELRGTRYHGPVLMLTARSGVRDKVTALNIGADDYLVKPFNMQELLARVHALLRRSHGKRSIPANSILIIDNFKINLDTRKCESNRGEVVLSEKEVKLLAFFSQHAGQTLRRSDILEEVWGMDVFPTPRTVDNFVLKFRKLFENNPEAPRHFISVRNQGYRFEK